MRSIYIMATPVEGGPSIIGNASDVCVQLWGTISSGYPRYIVKALSSAREERVYRGYRMRVISYEHRPILLPPRERKEYKSKHTEDSYPTPLAPVEGTNVEDISIGTICPGTPA